MIHRPSRRGFLAAGMAAALPSAPAAATPYPLGRHPHLFLDDFLLHALRKVRRRVQQPERHPANPVLTGRYPWESLRVHPYGGVVYDERQRLFRMWYMPYGPEWKPSRTAYAESTDGIHWEKPMLDIHKFPGYDRTNIVLAPEGGSNGIGVFRDPHDADPARRYKAMFDAYASAGRVQRVSFSPDGLHWNPPQGIQVLKGKKDSGIAVFWSERLGKYLAYMRAYDADPKPPLPPPGVFRRRTHAVSESADFLKWSDPVTVIRTDAADGPNGTVQVYGMAVMPYGDIFIGLLCLLHIQDMVYENHPGTLNWDGAPAGNPLETGYLDVQLAASRDGKTWTRVGSRELFMPRGRPGDWDDEEIRNMQSWVVKDDRIYIYYLGSSNAHATGSPGSVGLATLPADRWLAVEPLFANQAGMVETRELTADGDTLLVNASAASGSLQVEALGPSGVPAAGCDAAACRLRRRDDLRYEVAWVSPAGSRGLRDLPSPFRLRFHLRGDAKLFAFQVA